MHEANRLAECMAASQPPEIPTPNCTGSNNSGILSMADKLAHLAANRLQ